MFNAKPMSLLHGFFADFCSTVAVIQMRLLYSKRYTAVKKARVVQIQGPIRQ